VSSGEDLTQMLRVNNSRTYNQRCSGTPSPITLLYKNINFVRYDFLPSPVPSIRKRRIALIGGGNRELGIVTAGEVGSLAE
jgi:hypothetical protein